jgi:hypothetical protein
VQRLLDYEDEVVAAATLLLDRHSLRSLEATFAESLYGLKRQRRGPGGGGAAAAAGQQQQHDGSGGGGGGTGGGAPLGRSGENWALLLSVLLPYAQAKAQRLYARHTQHRGVLGLALRRSAAAPGGGGGGGGGGAGWRGALERARVNGLELFVRAYPFLHAGLEAARFGYQLAYLLDVFDCHAPELHLLGQRLVRMSGPEMVRGGGGGGRVGRGRCPLHGPGTGGAWRAQRAPACAWATPHLVLPPHPRSRRRGWSRPSSARAARASRRRRSAAAASAAASRARGCGRGSRSPTTSAAPSSSRCSASRC